MAIIKPIYKYILCGQFSLQIVSKASHEAFSPVLPEYRVKRRLMKCQSFQFPHHDSRHSEAMGTARDSNGEIGKFGEFPVAAAAGRGSLSIVSLINSLNREVLAKT